jgi:hypothetical protein
MRDKLFLQCQDGGWLAGFFGADNLRDFSKQLFRRNRRIRGGQSVTLRDEAWIFKIGGRANYAMHEEPFFASIQNDVAGKNVSECASLDEKYVSWPNGREHALPSNLQTQSAEAAQNLCGTLASACVMKPFCCACSCPAFHGFCRTKAPKFRKRARNGTWASCKAFFVVAARTLSRSVRADSDRASSY